MLENREKPTETPADETLQPAGPINRAAPELRRRIANRKKRLDILSTPDGAGQTAPPSAARSSVLLRPVELTDPGQQTLLGQYGPSAPRLDIAPPPDRLPEEGTEQLLNALIGECHFLMREVAFRSMCQTTALEDRMRWVDRAMKLAKTGAKVAKGVAELRHGPRTKESRHTLAIENNVAAAARGV